MKLNIGASYPANKYKKDGWLNVDIEKHDKVAVVADGTFLPFKENTFEETHCIHVLEHLTRDKQLPFLKELYRVSADGASTYIEVPNFIVTCGDILREWKNSNYEQVRIWTVAVFGKSERAGMAHHWGFNTVYLENLISSAGFTSWDYPEQMISDHYKYGAVILIRAIK